MDTIKSFLFVTWEGGGNIPPVLGLARQLVKRGHQVRILAEPCLEQPIIAIGAEFIAFTEHFTRTDRTEDLIQDWNAGPLNTATFDNIIVSPAKSVAEETLRIINAKQTDVVVADLMMVGSLIAAESKGIPRVALFHMPEYLPGPNRPPGGFGLTPRNDILGKIRNHILSFVFTRVTGSFVERINQVRAGFHLPEIKAFADLYHQADLRLIQTSSDFDSAITPAPDNVIYTGPVLDDPDWSTTCEPILFDRTYPQLALVSLSSTFQNQQATIQNAIDAIGNLPISGLVTLGPAMAKKPFCANDNVTVLESYPHNKILPKCQVVVTHAGHGTVMRALSHGKPLVCLPMGRDQTDNAALVAYHGAGIKLDSKASTKKIANAIHSVLNNPEFTENAKRLQQAILSETSRNLGVEALEGLKCL